MLCVLPQCASLAGGCPPQPSGLAPAFAWRAPTPAHGLAQELTKDTDDMADRSGTVDFRGLKKMLSDAIEDEDED